MADEFKPSVGSQVSKVKAKEWIDKFDKERKKDTRSVFFGRDVLLRILSIDGSAGISFFFARKFDDGQKKEVDTLVMVPTTEDGTLMWTDNEPETMATKTGSQTYDSGTGCPPYCPK